MAREPARHRHVLDLGAGLLHGLDRSFDLVIQVCPEFPQHVLLAQEHAELLAGLLVRRLGEQLRVAEHDDPRLRCFLGNRLVDLLKQRLRVIDDLGTALLEHRGIAVPHRAELKHLNEPRVVAADRDRDQIRPRQVRAV